MLDKAADKFQKTFHRNSKTTSWCNGKHSHLACRRFGLESLSGQTKDFNIGICCFSAKHAALTSKSKD